MTWPCDPVDHADDRMSDEALAEDLAEDVRLDDELAESLRLDREAWDRLLWEVAMERDADLPDLVDERREPGEGEG